MADGANRSAAPATYRVNTEDIAAFLAALRKHEDKTRLQREMRAGLAKATEPFQRQLSDTIPRALPASGGLGPLIQSEAKFSTVARTGRWAGLWVRATAKASAGKKSRDLNQLLGKGRFRHPVYLSEEREYRERPPWVWQTAGTNPSLITAVITRAAPDMRNAALEVLEAVARQIIKEST